MSGIRKQEDSKMILRLRACVDEESNNTFICEGWVFNENSRNHGFRLKEDRSRSNKPSTLFFFPDNTNFSRKLLASGITSLVPPQKKFRKGLLIFS